MNISPKRIFDFCAAYGVAVVLLFILLVLTFLGTLEQTEVGIFAAQEKYFNSTFFIDEFLGIPFVLPGAYLVCVLLFINMTCGAIIRARKDWRHPGMLIAHGGILFMLASGAVTYHYSESGHMTLFPNESADEFQSYYEWEIYITEGNTDGPRKEYTITHDMFAEGEPGVARTFHAEGLPFELEVRDFMKNSVPVRAPMAPSSIEGISLVEADPAPQAEQNVAGAIGIARNPETGEEVKGHLWGLASMPWIFEMDGRDWLVDLRHRRFPVPFTIALNEFIKEDHPGMAMASNFESRVTQTDENGSSRAVQIKMNEPLRDEGFTFFQASWGPENARPGEPLFSTFAVVRNPADQWPKYACYIIALGMSIHFIQKLAAYLRRENRRRAAT